MNFINILLLSYGILTINFKGTVINLKSHRILLTNNIEIFESDIAIKTNSGTIRYIKVPFGKIGNIVKRPAHLPILKIGKTYVFSPNQKPFKTTKQTYYSYYSLSQYKASKLPKTCGYILETNQFGVRLWWKHTCIDIHPANKLASTLHLLLNNGIYRWNQVIKDKSSLQLRIKDITDQDFSYQNTSNYNVIIPIYEDWIWNHNAEAITLLTYIEEQDYKDDGLLLDADILLNFQNYEYNLRDSTDLLHLSLLTTHELGHLIGLDHPCGDTTSPDLPSCFSPTLSENISTSIMFPYSSKGNESPNTCDASGVITLFPDDDPRTCGDTYLPVGTNMCNCKENSSENYSDILIVFFTISILFFIKKYKKPKKI